MKYLTTLFAIAMSAMCIDAGAYEMELTDGKTLIWETVGHNYVRMRIDRSGKDSQAKELVDRFFYAAGGDAAIGPKLDIWLSGDENNLEFVDAQTGEVVLRHENLNADGKATFVAPGEKALFGLGQFQDGYVDVKDLSRRLTQVNTQISVPVVISDAGYGIIWNNCGLTNYNPCDHAMALRAAEGDDLVETVDATSTAGNVREERHYGEFVGEIEVPADAQYAVLLDVGQKMARKHFLQIDGQTVMDANNLWLPPTNAALVDLKQGKHKVRVLGEKNDNPVLQWRKADGTTTFASEDGSIDYTVILGTPDEIISTYRQLTGQVPMLPKWAFGYVHCRERYVSQDDVLANATEFRRREIPIDMIVQDWQWWGKNGWNAMKFDQDWYPDPKAMTDSLHAMDVRLMLSVWAKVDKNSALGHELEPKGCYIDGTEWIDFFNAPSAEAYWEAYRDNLLPTGIDAWWQDATEPENDDLDGRMVEGGKLSGNAVRNVFPIAVNDRVYKGLCEERSNLRPMILTRCGAPGIQRYGVVTWSGDVGNDYETLRKQIAGGLGQQAAGLPWWTYDAGGFFRPGDQYVNDDYQKTMLRWIQASVFLPVMRVHGYMSQTEPWRYPQETSDKFIESIRLRYRLLPYIYSLARKVSEDGYTMMRPLVFDFPDSPYIGEGQYMLGDGILVAPIYSNSDKSTVALPACEGGWYDLFTNERLQGGQKIEVANSPDHINAYAKGGSIVVMAEPGAQSTVDIGKSDKLIVKVYPGADAQFTVYDDDGVSNEYRQGGYCKVPLSWDDQKRTLTLGAKEGKYPHKSCVTVVLPDGTSREVAYKGKRKQVKF